MLISLLRLRLCGRRSSGATRAASRRRIFSLVYVGLWNGLLGERGFVCFAFLS